MLHPVQLMTEAAATATQLAAEQAGALSRRLDNAMHPRHQHMRSMWCICRQHLSPDIRQGHAATLFCLLS